MKEVWLSCTPGAAIGTHGGALVEACKALCHMSCPACVTVRCRQCKGWLQASCSWRYAPGSSRCRTPAHIKQAVHGVEGDVERGAEGLQQLERHAAHLAKVCFHDVAEHGLRGQRGGRGGTVREHVCPLELAGGWQEIGSCGGGGGGR